MEDFKTLIGAASRFGSTILGFALVATSIFMPEVLVEMGTENLIVICMLVLMGANNPKD